MYYVIIDFEATCCDEGSVPKDEMEIIEFGVVVLNGADLQPIDEFQRFVRPKRHTQLTPFCQQLTSIRQKHVDTADSFKQVLTDFSDWLQAYQPACFCSWGAYDKRQLQQDCQYHQQPYPFDEQHINIKKDFATALGWRRPSGLGRALKQVGLEFEGTAHRGIDDARNIARLAAQILPKTP